MASPFSIFIYTSKSKRTWYARFYDERTGKLIKTKSTKVPVKGKNGGKVEAHKRAEELSREMDKIKSPYLLPYLESFWKPDSPYARAKKIIEKKPLSLTYIQLNDAGIRTMVLPYEPFHDLRITDLKPGLIKDWQLWCLENGKGARRVNAVMQAMKVPINYLLSRGDIEIDPFRNVKKIPYSPKEKGILNQEEVGNLIESKENDPRVKLAVLLAVLSGLRRGEVRGLRWKDIDYKAGLINVENNYIDREGSKPCKWGSSRQVLLSSPFLPLLESIRAMSPFTEQEDFVLFDLKQREAPVSVETIRKGFTRILEISGIPHAMQKQRNLTFHGMRHTFVTLARLSGLPDITVQALAGHKSAEMMNHYSHAGQVIDFEDARKRMESLQVQKAPESSEDCRHGIV